MWLMCNHKSDKSIRVAKLSFNAHFTITIYMYEVFFSNLKIRLVKDVRFTILVMLDNVNRKKEKL